MDTAGDKPHLARPLERLDRDLEPRRRNEMPFDDVFANAMCLVAIEAVVRSGASAKRARAEVSDASGHKVSDAYLENLRKNLPKRGSAGLRSMYEILLGCARKGEPAEAAQWCLQQVTKTFERR
jgi:hypothetical protein